MANPRAFAFVFNADARALGVHIMQRCTASTRGHSWALAKERCKLDIRKYAFSQRTINEWNRLSGECVNATSVNMFKNKIDNYFKRAGCV